MPPSFHARRLAPLLLLALGACNREDGAAPPAPSASPGQVKPVQASAVSRYAAARFADQVSFGATPALVAEIQAKGYARWIDDQFALPVSTIDAKPIKFLNNDNQAQREFDWRYHNMQLASAVVGSPDQLRHRVSFALSQYITISLRKADTYGGLLYANLLQEHAFGNYGSLIRAVTISPAMGEFLDNISNRPKSEACPSCAPNENYARELMQLFTLGVVKLNQDGSVQRDARRLPAESYSQKDVEELARALTGWNWANTPLGYDRGRYEGKLIPDSWDVTHDRGEKRILGSTVPAGGGPNEDLDAVVAILMAHPNIAPFVSTRLIQHLVMSNPSPAYIARVAAVFRNNGQGVSGDMKAVIKAVLLDPDARAGDSLASQNNSVGKIREPVLWMSGLVRGLECAKPLNHPTDGGVAWPQSQHIMRPESVFSFYAPTDRAPGSNLLAPEQRLLNASELAGRMWGYWLDDPAYTAAGQCKTAPFIAAFQTSPNAFADLVGERYFRGAMPAALRQTLIEMAPVVWGDTPHQRAMHLLLYALATPYYGAIR